MSAVVPVVETLSYRELLTVSVVNVAVCTACLIAFGIVRSIKRNRYFFAPLYHSVPEENTCPLHGEPSTAPNPTKPDVPDPGKGPIAWIYPTLKFRQDDMLATRGLDPVMHLRSLKLMFMILGLVAIPGLAVLVPIHATSTHQVKLPDGNYNNTDVTGVGALSMSNIPDQSPKMWAHVFSVWIFTLVACIMTYREYARYAHFRTQYNSENKAHNHSIMVKQVPSFITSSEHLESYFRRFFGTKIVSAHMPLPSNDLRKLLKKRDKAVLNLQRCETLAKEGPLKRHMHMQGARFWFSKKQDAIMYYGNKVEEINQQIEETRRTIGRQTPDKRKHNRSAGFVTFRSIGEAYVCAQSVLSSDDKSGKPVPAPDLDDVYWHHLTRLSIHASKALYLASLAFFTLVIIFWGASTAFLSSIANIDQMDKISWLKWLHTILSVSTFVEDIARKYLPFVLVVLLQSFLPDIIYGVLKLRGEPTRSRLEKSALKVHFTFLVFNVFLIFTITTSTFSIWNEILDLMKKSVPDLINTFGQTLPSGSTSFINYLLVYGLSSLPQQMLRIGPYIVSLVRTHTAVTRCEKWDASRPSYPLYGIWYANCLLVFLISITYSVIAPLTVVFGLLVLAIEYTIAKYRYMYVTPQRFHSGAYLWPMLYNRMIFCIIISHVTLIGVFSLKLFIPGVIATLPIPFLTLLFAKHTTKKYFYRSRFLPISEFPPVATAQGMVGNDGSYGHIQTSLKFKDAYMDPALSEAAYATDPTLNA